jgi:hypothetical protein
MPYHEILTVVNTALGRSGPPQYIELAKANIHCEVSSWKKKVFSLHLNTIEI